MLSMKNLYAFISLLLIPALSIAQTGRLINRIDKQIASSITRNSVILPTTPEANKSFSISFPSQTITLSNDGVGPISLIGTITVNGSAPVNINFHRTHVHLPDGWLSSVCFGSSCYSTTTDSLPVAYAFAPNVAGSFTLDFYCPKTATQTDSIVDYIKLDVQDGDPGDTMSFFLTGILTVESAVLDQQNTLPGSPKITAIYPSPLVQGNAIRVKVTSPRESNLSYSIYDALGRVVALGVTRQRVGLGDNTISIGSLDGLGNGSYLLKFNFGDGSSDSHFFQILR
jgi:hypothetical protein